MSSTAFASIKADEIDSLKELLDKFGEKSHKIVNEVLHSDEAAKVVEDNISALLPFSNRNWKGKSTPASQTQPFRSDNSELLTLIIKTKKKYNYLYFPDDGSNTNNHRGNQHFMKRGADASVSTIAQLCAAQLINEF